MDAIIRVLIEKGGEFAFSKRVSVDINASSGIFTIRHVFGSPPK
jgi:hypothetical protein